MNITANTTLGHVIHGRLVQRFNEAGLAIPPITVGTLGQTFMRVGQFFRAKGVDPNMPEVLFHADPELSFCYYILVAMQWTALLRPEDATHAAQIARHLRDKLPDMGAAPLTTEETDELAAQLVRLVATPQAKGELGALGDALHHSIAHELRTVPSGSQGRRRRFTFMRYLKETCVAIEEEPNLAARKHLASLLGEALTRELRESSCRSPGRIMRIFWDGFNLFFTARA